jgi:DNA replication ATP-dependent helicase Dna2
VIEPGRFIDEFKVIRRLGYGGFGSVYLAQDTTLDRLVAIKEIHQLMAAHAEVTQRFIQEAKTAGGLNHPHIVTVYGLRPKERPQYLILEFVSGGNVRDRLIRLGKLPVEMAVRIAAETCEALAAVHAKGIIHRDIKPENLLLTQDGWVKVSDFGIAHVPQSAGGSPLTHTGFQPGTIIYMSPEQIRGEALSGKSDVYTLGVVLYEMLVGKHYFDPEALLNQAMQEVGAKNPRAPAVHAHWMSLVARRIGGGIALGPSFPGDLARLVQSAMSASASRRPEAADFGEKLHSFLERPAPAKGGAPGVEPGDLDEVAPRVSGSGAGPVWPMPGRADQRGGVVEVGRRPGTGAAGSAIVKEAGILPARSGVECLVCRITHRGCDRPVLQGSILEVHMRPGGSAWVRVRTPEAEEARLYLEEPWADLAHRLDEPPGTYQAGAHDLAAHHLEAREDGLIASAESLVVLDPDWLTTVSDLSNVDFCQRQLPLSRLIPPGENAEMIRGNVVHAVFPTIWNSGPGSDLEAAKARALSGAAEAMALARARPGEVAEVVEEHIRHLAQWAARQASRESDLRTETFILSPSVGMKGRTDALWERGGLPVVLGELKTGKSRGKDPKPGHVLQLLSYALGVIALEGMSPDALTTILLYSGNDMLGNDGRNVPRRVPLDLRRIQESMRARNSIVLIDHTGHADFELNPNKCRSCRQEQDCARWALLAEQDDSRSKKSSERLAGTGVRPDAATAAFFQHYARLLTDELRALKAQHANLWALSPEQRLEEGKALAVGEARRHSGADAKPEYELTASRGRNESELRVGDSVLLSGEGGPGLGRCSTGFVTKASLAGITVRTDGDLLFKPAWVDLYTDERLTENLFSGLYLFLVRNPRLAQIVVNRLMPSFGSAAPPVRIPRHLGDVAELNEAQQEALDHTSRAADYLLVLGPPGSGKTMLIDHIVRAQLALGRRVLISAGTNRAVDEALRRLAANGLESSVLRLGDPGTAAPELQAFTLPALMSEAADLERRVAVGAEALRSRRVVGATAQTLLGGRFDAALGRFDLVIVDEAAQLTVPATLGPLRFGERFVLIGDHNQLPAVVLSKPNPWAEGAPQRAEGDLDVSLFEILIHAIEKKAAPGLVRLRDQYRMNDAICSVPSKLWYGGELKPANQAIGAARLQMALEGGAPGAIAPDRPIVFLDVDPDPSGGPRTNATEGRIVRRLVADLVRRGVRTQEGEGRGQIAVIAPFRAQVALIRRELEEEFPGKVGAVRAMVDTVDRFQGSESDVVILSFANWADFVHELLRDERRLNVALTRARHKLILLGSGRVLRSVPTYVALLEEIGKNAGYEDWMQRGVEYLAG